MQISRAAGVVAPRGVEGDGGVAGVEVMAVFDEAADFGGLLVVDAVVPARVEVDGSFAACHLGGAGVVGVVGEGGRRCALGDGAGEVEGGVAEAAAATRAQVTVGIVAVAADQRTGFFDAGDGVRPGRGGFAVEVLIAHVGFGGDVAVRRIGVGLGRGAGDAGEAVELVVAEGFGEAPGVVLARGEIA